jgi:hypothetical protein
LTRYFPFLVLAGFWVSAEPADVLEALLDFPLRNVLDAAVAAFAEVTRLGFLV